MATQAADPGIYPAYNAAPFFVDSALENEFPIEINKNYASQLPRQSGTASGAKPVLTFWVPIEVPVRYAGEYDGFFVTAAADPEHTDAFTDMEPYKVRFALCNSNGQIYNTGASDSGTPGAVLDLQMSTAITWLAARQAYSTLQSATYAGYAFAADEKMMVKPGLYWIQVMVEILDHAKKRPTFVGTSRRMYNVVTGAGGSGSAIYPPGLSYRLIRVLGIDVEPFIDQSLGFGPTTVTASVPLSLMTPNYNSVVGLTLDTLFTTLGQVSWLHLSVGLWRQT